MSPTMKHSDYIASLIPDKLTDYVPNPDLDMPLRFYLRSGMNVALIGAKASGKTESLMNYCAESGTCLFQQSGASDISTADVRGAQLLEAASTRWVDGPLAAAMRLSKEGVNTMYLLDEATATEPSILSMLFSVADRRRTLYIAETGEMLKAGESFTLCLAGNSEGAHVRGTISDAMRSRFQVITVTDDHAMKIRAKNLADMAGVSDPKDLLRICNEIRAAGGEADARDLARAAVYYSKVRKAESVKNPLQYALQMAFAGCSDKMEIVRSVTSILAMRK